MAIDQKLEELMGLLGKWRPGPPAQGPHRAVNRGQKCGESGRTEGGGFESLIAIARRSVPLAD